MVDRLKHFPFKTCLLLLFFVSVIINVSLYNELKIEQEKRYWVSGSEYKQIINEIKRLESNPLGVK
jgi:hypothetical protein